MCAWSVEYIIPKHLQYTVLVEHIILILLKSYQIYFEVLTPLKRSMKLRTADSQTNTSTGFTYILDRLMPRASKFRGPSAKVHNMLNIVIGLQHLCCHNVLYFLNNTSVIFLTQLHSISEYCRILNTPHHLCLYWNWLNTLPSSSSREGGELEGDLRVD